MKEVFPSYYHKFKCIAERCTHSCCIGWEIDIDEDTMSYYKSLDTALGERIRANIDEGHFVLREGERCPFLNKNGLCDIICECGEEVLCDICTLHPRFRNFYTSFYETGLGLCCEEAARIILSEQEKFSIILPDDIDIPEVETEFFEERQKIFSVLQDREVMVGERFSTLANLYGLEFNYSISELCDLYLSLERLDESWTYELAKLKNFSFDKKIFEDKDLQTAFEQLAVYFIFRHLEGAMWDGDYVSRVNFALMSCYLIGGLVQEYKITYGAVGIEKMVDFVRMYSSEVEYSEENLEILLT